MNRITHTMNSPHRQQGLTLIEIMVAITLSLVLLAGVLQIFISNRQTYRVQEAMSRVQESGRFAINFLSQDVRMAGFTGCVGMSSGLEITNNLDPTSTVAYDHYDAQVEDILTNFSDSDSLQGFSVTSSVPSDLSNMGLVMGSATGNLLPNTDVLIIKRGGSCPGANVVSHSNSGGSAQFHITDNSQCLLQQNEVVMVSDCRTADIFGISNSPSTSPGTANIAHGANWNQNPPHLANNYGPDASIYRLYYQIFYVGVGESGEPSLFRRGMRINAGTTGSLQNYELVEGVEGLSLLYGEDTDTPADGIANHYVTAGGVTDWDQVVSVRIDLDVRSAENNVTVVETDEGDRRLRRNFTSTVAVRNRVP